MFTREIISVQKEILREIRRMADPEKSAGKPPTAAGRESQGQKLLTFVPGQLAVKPMDYFTETIKTQTVVGKKSKHPIALEIPVVIAAMSYGALSKNAKLALAKASTLAGTADNTGEGGIVEGQRKAAEILIAQYSTARFGVTEEYLKSADAIEIKIGQGAKPGQGGLLLGQKVTEEIARTRSTPEKPIMAGQTLHSPAYHSDINSPADLKKKVQWLRRITGGKPIIIKLGAGDIEADIKYALQAHPDVIAIDGSTGGTGAAPRVMLEAMGLPTLPTLVRARKALDESKFPPELWIGGGFNLGEDIAVALALGADAVFLGFSLMMAMGCAYCGECYLGKCKQGISTQDPELMTKLNIDEASQKAANFLRAINEEVKMIAGACGVDDVHKLNKNHLRAYSPELARALGIKSVWEE